MRSRRQRPTGAPTIADRRRGATRQHGPRPGGSPLSRLVVARRQQGGTAAARTTPGPLSGLGRAARAAPSLVPPESRSSRGTDGRSPLRGHPCHERRAPWSGPRSRSAGVPRPRLRPARPSPRSKRGRAALPWRARRPPSGTPRRRRRRRGSRARVSVRADHRPLPTDESARRVRHEPRPVDVARAVDIRRGDHAALLDPVRDETRRGLAVATQRHHLHTRVEQPLRDRGADEALRP
jgi:hypothetical protein